MIPMRKLTAAETCTARVKLPNGESFTTQYDGQDPEAKRKIIISALMLGMQNDMPEIEFTADITAGLPPTAYKTFFGKDGELLPVRK
jgi:hypothetical protein